MDIVACTDKFFIMPTGVMMYSVCCNNQNTDIVFHILIDDSVSSRDKNDLEDTIKSFQFSKIIFYTVDLAIISSMPALDRSYGITKAAYYRLMLSEILPASIHKILYLDGDLIVRGSLLPLWETDISGHAIAAATDGLCGRIEIYNRLRYPIEKGYFNSGVLLVNLDFWRHRAALELFNHFIINHAERIRLWDQDVLNCVFQDNKIMIPIKYNLSSGFLYVSPEFDYWKYEKELVEAIRDPVVVHFAGAKPWDAYQRVFHPFQNTWTLYQNQTKWRGLKYDRRPLKLRVHNSIADTLRRLKIFPQNGQLYINISPID